MLLENLKKMSRDELIRFADTQGVKIHWKAGEAKIIEAIVAKVTQPVTMMHKEAPKVINGVEVEQPKLTQLMAKRMQDAAEAKRNTPESIEAAIAHIKARLPSEFVSTYNREENTWQFSCKGAVESGNICIPMRKIIGIAQIVSRGRLIPITANREFDNMNTATGNNAYTNTIFRVG